MTTTPELREQIRAALQRQGISQAEAARALGLTPKHVSAMLTGKAELTLAWADRMAALCGLRVNVRLTPGARAVVIRWRRYGRHGGRWRADLPPGHGVDSGSVESRSLEAVERFARTIADRYGYPIVHRGRAQQPATEPGEEVP